MRLLSAPSASPSTRGVFYLTGRLQTTGGGGGGGGGEEKMSKDTNLRFETVKEKTLSETVKEEDLKRR